MGPVSSMKGAMTSYRCRGSMSIRVEEGAWLKNVTCRIVVRERIDIEVVFDVESRSPVA